MEFHVYFHFPDPIQILDPRVDAKLDQILTALGEIKEKETHMTAELDNLTVVVTDTEGIEQSAITLLEGLAAQIAALKDDPVAIQALADSLKAQSDALAAAVAANQPVP